MAPEVLRKERSTAASDIYSFGVCALQAFAPTALAVKDETTNVRKIPIGLKDLEPELHEFPELLEPPQRQAAATPTTS